MVMFALLVLYLEKLNSKSRRLSSPGSRLVALSVELWTVKAVKMVIRGALCDQDPVLAPSTLYGSHKQRNTKDVSRYGRRYFHTPGLLLRKVYCVLDI